MEDEYKDIFKYIKDKPIDINEISRLSKIKLDELNSKLIMLELEGRILKIFGNKYIRNNLWKLKGGKYN